MVGCCITTHHNNHRLLFLNYSTNNPKVVVTTTFFTVIYEVCLNALQYVVCLNALQYVVCLNALQCYYNTNTRVAMLLSSGLFIDCKHVFVSVCSLLIYEHGMDATRPPEYSQNGDE